MIRRSNIVRGMLIYPLGDALAAGILGQFSIVRMLGMTVLGGTLYAWEIPLVFRWIDRHVPVGSHRWAALRRSLLAVLYFNPLWIARHLLFIKLFSGAWEEVRWSLLAVGMRSFLVNVPIALAGNHVIQNIVPREHRFAASAIFSGLMALYYAMSAVWFG